jgi:Fe-S-cluster containining protein
MDYTYLFEPYQELVLKAEAAFHKTAGEHPLCVTCKPRCSDCCHAVFGLFLIEAVFLRRDFELLSEEDQKAALGRCKKVDHELSVLEGTLREFKDDPQMSAYSMAKTRIRCPLLSDAEECILYPYRPLTCRVYGIPTLIQGAARVCGKSGFKKDQPYPTFNLDWAYRELFQQSQELLKGAGAKDVERAALLLSVSKIIQTPVEELIGNTSG